MRLHWCALDDPGGALGLKNRLIRAVKKMIDLYSRSPLILLLTAMDNHKNSQPVSQPSQQHSVGLGHTKSKSAGLDHC